MVRRDAPLGRSQPGARGRHGYRPEGSPALSIDQAEATAPRGRLAPRHREGSMAPRSRIDGLVDLNDSRPSGNFGEVPAGPNRLNDKTTRPRRGPGRDRLVMLIGGDQGTGSPRWPLQMGRNPSLWSARPTGCLHLPTSTRSPSLLNRSFADSAARPPANRPARSRSRTVAGRDPSELVADGSGARRRKQHALRPSLGRIARYGQNLSCMRGTRRQPPFSNQSGTSSASTSRCRAIQPGSS